MSFRPEWSSRCGESKQSSARSGKASDLRCNTFERWRRLKYLPNQGDGRRLPATHLGPKPDDFPVGSLQSRVAARSMLATMFAWQCICFPPDEPPDLALKAEIESAKSVRCPLHGIRFGELAPTIYVAAQYRQPTHLHPERWKWRSPQYIKAMDASLPPDRWPTQEIVDPDGGVRFVLKDGTEIHRISPPPR